MSNLNYNSQSGLHWRPGRFASMTGQSSTSVPMTSQPPIQRIPSTPVNFDPSQPGTFDFKTGTTRKAQKMGNQRFAVPMGRPQQVYLPRVDEDEKKEYMDWLEAAGVSGPETYPSNPQGAQEALDSASYTPQPIKSSRGNHLDFAAVDALSLLVNVERARPIFDTVGDISMGESLPSSYDSEVQAYSDHKNNIHYELTIEISSNIPKFSEVLRQAVYNNEKPLLFLITSNVHAVIYIIHEGNLYTCGYGFLGGRSELPTLNKASNAIGKVSEKAGHTVEVLPGSIYTADYFAPTPAHAARIAWVGFLTIDIIARFQEFLNSTVSITYEIKKEPRNIVTNNAKLKLRKTYLESAGFCTYMGCPVESYNCLLWAQKVLNINIDCGYLGDPASCKSITPVEFDKFTAFFQSGWNPQLDETVKRIQARLEAPRNICSRISRDIGLCFGNKGGKTRKNMRKNIRKNKKRKSNKVNKKRKSIKK